MSIEKPETTPCKASLAERNTARMKSLLMLASYASLEAVTRPKRLADKVRFKLRGNVLGRIIDRWMDLKGDELEMLDDGCFEELTANGSNFWVRLAARHNMVQVQAEFLASAPLGAATRSPRVLFLITNSFPFTQSGYAIRTHSLLTSLQEQGIYLEAVTRLGYPAVAGKITDSARQVVDGVTYHRMLDWRYPFSVAKARQASISHVVRLARQMRATHIHTTTDYENAAVASAAAAILAIPWVYEVRGEPTETWVSKVEGERQLRRKASWYAQHSRKLELAAMNAAGGVIYLSEVSRTYFVPQLRSGLPTVIVPNSINSNELGSGTTREEARRALGGFEGFGKWVGSVSAIVNYEGFDTLIRSLEYLDETTAVLLVGDGTARQELETLAKELGVAHRVRFAGAQPFAQIAQWYSALDVFVVPRRYLAVCERVTPIKAQKAMALGLPVVASNLPALKEVTGNTAEYFQPNSPRDLAAAIQKAQGTSQENSREWIAQQTWETMSRRMVNFYFHS